MIPKVIHYCWFGRGEMPKLGMRCIKSWKKHLPDYEIKLWNEDNFDINRIPYTAEAFEAKKYAFVSDYARFWILYHYGGIYFDTDVEMIKPIDEILAKGPFFACEIDGGDLTSIACAPGLGLAAYPNMDIYNKMLDLYQNLHFLNKDKSYNLTTVVEYTTQILQNYGLQNVSGIQKVKDFWIYPTEYFCPLDYATKEMTITEKTVCIHHFAGTWISKRQKLKNRIKNTLGDRNTQIVLKLKRYLKRI
ncbi:MAG: glycosyl transferase [Bacteroidales bacterium]|nr:glycosyl transferase [Bacteroidales bacterium]